MATAKELAQFDISAFFSSTSRVKVFMPTNYNRHGTSYRIYKDPDDGDAATKEASAHEAIRLIRAKGVTIPPDMRFYMTSTFEAQNRAFHFDPLGNAISWVTLGPRALAGGSGNGISAQQTAGIDAATKICIHEIGHSIHAQAIGLDEFFKPAVAGRWKGQAANGNKVSAYANGTKKEFVAEVFLGMIIGRTYDAATMQEYADLGGPPVGP